VRNLCELYFVEAAFVLGYRWGAIRLDEAVSKQTGPPML
jgi:hypothetical protein